MAQAISKMETSQTAVSWLIEEIHKNMGVWIPLHIQDQAKQMEKEQIIDAFYEGMQANTFDQNKGRALMYYNKTYNK